jgi:hypothetical protein
VSGGLAGIYLQGLPDQFHGYVMAAPLVLQHAQQMQSIKVRRRLRQYFPVQAFGVSQLAALMMGDGLPQLGGNGLRRDLSDFAKWSRDTLFSHVPEATDLAMTGLGNKRSVAVKHAASGGAVLADQGRQGLANKVESRRNEQR